ncbi:6-phosphogluconolactonase-like [Oppia nitens]|uniref:6-phosphogluconolactonase-like n=1 Tax=Oppia nitens TaxID=1686743 RepID=UPI0023DB11AA|nr:6-phosphogluconolactonase-like [Oppia nitens]
MCCAVHPIYTYRNTYSVNILYNIFGFKLIFSSQMSQQIRVVKTSRGDCPQIVRSLLEQTSRDSTDKVFSVGLSGGSVVDVLIEALPSADTDWSKWRFLLCDERLVAEDNPDNTYGQYARRLAPQLVKVERRQWLSVDTALDPQQAADDYERRVRQELCGADSADQWPSVDVLVLGMGEDGHTCSLFPSHPLLEEKKRWIAAITDSPKPPPSRVTMTLPAVNASRLAIFVSLGASKAQTLYDMFVDHKPLPASLVAPPSGRVVWLVDDASARLLPPSVLSTTVG